MPIITTIAAARATGKVTGVLAKVHNPCCGAALSNLLQQPVQPYVHVVHVAHLPSLLPSPAPLPAVEALRDMSKGALEQVPLQDYFK